MVIKIISSETPASKNNRKRIEILKINNLVSTGTKVEGGRDWYRKARHILNDFLLQLAAFLQQAASHVSFDTKEDKKYEKKQGNNCCKRQPMCTSRCTIT